MADQREPLFSLSVPKLKTGLKEHKNNLRRQQSAPWQCFAETIAAIPPRAAVLRGGIEMTNLSLITLHYILTTLPVLPAEEMFSLCFLKDFR